MTRWLPIVLLTLVTLALPCPAAAGGHLVLNGGGSKPAEVMRKFIELAGGPGASIVVVTTASELPETGDYYRELFEGEYGCTRVTIAHFATAEEANDPAITAVVRAAKGVFFSGGDQRRITAALKGSAVGQAVLQAFEGGGVVGGTSAGTACQSPLMITGDGDFTVITADNVELWDGLGLFKGVIVDQHFVARQRHNRLMSVILEHPDLLGIGIDEATAVWVRPDGTLRVLGEGWVVVYDAGNARITRRGDRDGRSLLGALGLTTHLLLPGDELNLRTRTVTTRPDDRP